MPNIFFQSSPRTLPSVFTNVLILTREFLRRKFLTGVFQPADLPLSRTPAVTQICLMQGLNSSKEQALSSLMPIHRPSFTRSDTVQPDFRALWVTSIPIYMLGFARIMKKNPKRPRGYRDFLHLQPSLRSWPILRRRSII